MRLPVDIGAVLKAATDVEAASKVRVSATVLLDEGADALMAGHVRGCFAGADSRARVTIGYMDGQVEPVGTGADIAVVVAGAGLEAYVLAACQAAAFREAGTPVMVVTESPRALLEAASAADVALDAADVLAPARADVVGAGGAAGGGEGASSAAAAVAGVAGAAAGKVCASAVRAAKGVASAVLGGGTSEQEVRAYSEPIELTDAAFAILDERMGRWIIDASPASKLAFALAFPFVRRPLANEAIAATSAQNAAVGLIPILPGADMPVMTLNQAKMLMQIAAAYGQPINKERVKELVALVAGAFALRNVARTATRFVPFAGPVISGAVGFAGTEAMGRAAIDYFEAGGDIMGVANALQNARDAAVDAGGRFAKTPVGQKVADASKSAAKQAFSKVRG